MKLAARTGRIAPSPTLSLTATAKAMAAQGIKVVDFSVGEPDFDTPDNAKAAAQEALAAGFTKYTAVSGIDDLKSVIRDKLLQDQGLGFASDQILVSCGAKHSLFNLAAALFEEGDEVIIPSPFWVSYRDQVLFHNATPVTLPTLEEEGYAISPHMLQERVTSRTKAIILNSPCNPTGAMYNRATLEGIARVAVDRDFLIISDEIYEKLIYDGNQHVSIASLGKDVQARTVIVNGVSKAYSMTGWRIGYAAGPKDLIAAMTTIQGQSTSNATSIAQKAAVAALKSGDVFPNQMVKEFDRRRRFVVDRLNRIAGIRCPLPSGAFYAFPNITGLFGRTYAKGSIQCASDFSTYLLNEAQVVTVPGEPFGSASHIRLSYATSLDVLELGLERMEQAVKNLE